MAEIVISINARPFQIMCQDGEEGRVTRFAEDLAARVAELKENAQAAGDSHLLVLAGLTLLSELQDAQGELGAARQDLSKANEARAQLSEQLSTFDTSTAETLHKITERVEKILPQDDNQAADV